MGRPPKKISQEQKPEREDGRRMTSMFVKPAIMDALKKAAIDEKRNAYEIVEDAVLAYLKKAKRL
ncbi:hypothetical protein [Bradyrhizobium japonicum]|uniref:hypothetical protein n=1 Tax=Bradyrhizobium japonicum TaxID=375 RepID=UPI001BA660A7|nr:hypothetical protein [Bradyrhizobium japonicum]MBR0911490.1 hypothetical protein [Bradyrhizobium japonicum]